MNKGIRVCGKRSSQGWYKYVPLIQYATACRTKSTLGASQVSRAPQPLLRKKIKEMATYMAISDCRCRLPTACCILFSPFSSIFTTFAVLRRCSIDPLSSSQTCGRLSGAMDLSFHMQSLLPTIAANKRPSAHLLSLPTVVPEGVGPNETFNVRLATTSLDVLVKCPPNASPGDRVFLRVTPVDLRPAVLTSGEAGQRDGVPR